MDNDIFVRLDADGVGDKIELALLDNDIDRARAIHNAIRRSMSALVERITARGDIEIIMVGCDDILMRMQAASYQRSFFEALMGVFETMSECTISIGVGGCLADALHNLDKAKLAGKNRIVEPR